MSFSSSSCWFLLQDNFHTINNRNKKNLNELLLKIYKLLLKCFKAQLWSLNWRFSNMCRKVPSTCSLFIARNVLVSSIAVCMFYGLDREKKGFSTDNKFCLMAMWIIHSFFWCSTDASATRHILNFLKHLFSLKLKMLGFFINGEASIRSKKLYDGLLFGINQPMNINLVKYFTSKF